jgi:hypothetical protein
VPAEHEVHPVAPVVALYLPAIQEAHTLRPVLAAEVPVGHGVLCVCRRVGREGGRERGIKTIKWMNYI